uniref:Prepilin type IV endopeptidase peptidase domain-containing protein n=1 Tax=Glossina brevipalpis TaxID=37001 RepID=A0A1A9VZ54_9MUSC
MMILVLMVLSSIIMVGVYRFIPGYYRQARDAVIKEGEAFSQARITVRQYPLLAVSQPWLSFFLLLFATAAYIDAVTHWVPDALIYACSCFSVFAVTRHMDDVALLLSGVSSALLVLFMLVCNLWVKGDRQGALFGEGDIYLITAVGLWLSPIFSFVYIGIAYVMAMAWSWRKKHVAFVPFLYLTFYIYVVIEPSINPL